MADRFFPNIFPDFIPSEGSESEFQNLENSLANLLSQPYNSLSQTLKTAAQNIKQAVVREYWGSGGKLVMDYSLYTGALGIAFLLLKSYQVTKSKNDLNMCCDIVKACDSASCDNRRFVVTFICGQAGVFALGAVAASQNGDEAMLDHYLNKFKEIKLTKDIPNELLYGRAGFLWACSFLNKNLGKDTISALEMRPVVNDIIKAGRQLGNKKCPLMYEWHGKKYWGSAHGLAGIMHLLMDMELKPDESDDVKKTLIYMIKNRYPSGNYPSSEESESDRLVHWCHGAPGVALTLVKAAEVFGGEGFLQAAVDAGEVVWNRGLLKRVGICHGISGNTYVFLSLYRLTGKMEYLYRAKAFACFLHEKAQTLKSEGIMHGGDRPYSLFEGIAGTAYLFFDMVEPSESRFPAYEL